MGKKPVYFGMFTALALIFSYVESLIPFHIGIPGVKLGLANLVIVIVLYKADFRFACLLSITRIILAGFMFGSLFSIIYSLAGGMLSLAVMQSLKHRSDLSVIGVSIAGAVFHNAGQLAAAMLVTESLSLLYYTPFLLTAGLITGIVIGAAANEMLKRLIHIKF